MFLFIGSAFLTIGCFGYGHISGKTGFLTASFVCGVLFYHIAMRLAVAHLAKHNYNIENAWFKEKPFEKALYRKLRVRRWKKRMPSGNPESYSMNRTPAALVQTICRNEVIHEVSAVLSLAPIVLGFWCDAWGALIATSLLGSLFDLLFVCMQRYNRPRLVRFMVRKGGKSGWM